MGEPQGGLKLFVLPAVQETEERTGASWSLSKILNSITKGNKLFCWIDIAKLQSLDI